MVWIPWGSSELAILIAPERTPAFWWIGQRAGDALGLHSMAPIRQIFCCDFGREFPLLERVVGAEVHSLEADRRVRRFWNSHDILEVVDASSDIIERSGEDRSPPVAVLYRANRRFEQWAKQGKVRLAAPDFDLVDAADDNLIVYAQLRAAGIPQPRGDVIDLSWQSFDELAREYGLPLVVKRRHSTSGRGCHFVWSRDGLAEIARDAMGEPVLVTEFVHGISFNIHVVVGADGIVTSRPSIQVIGVEPCASSATIYCGNDFASARHLPDATLAAVSEAARRGGEWLGSLGYRGICGFDIIAEGGRAWLIDVNPRFQGSTCLLTQLEMLDGEYPTSLRHLREFVPDLVDSDVAGHSSGNGQKGNGQGAGGAQMILHSLADVPRRITRSLVPGVYRLNSRGGLEWMRSGLLITDCHETGEFLVTCAIPVEGTIVDPAAAYLKIITREAVLDVATSKLLPRARQIATAVAAVFHWEALTDTVGRVGRPLTATR